MTEKRFVVLSGGERVPYPEPSTPAATRIGKANRRAETKPEQRLRSELHRRGLRFRKDLLIRSGSVRTHADIAITRQRVAVFVDGCFWHSCPEHGSSPKSNTSYWGPKLRANVDRDRRVDAALRGAGWVVLRVWEHEDPEAGADRVERSVRRITN